MYSNFDTLRVKFPECLNIDKSRISIIGFDWEISIGAEVIMKYNQGCAFENFRDEYNKMHRGDSILIKKVYLTIDNIRHDFVAFKRYKSI